MPAVIRSAASPGLILALLCRGALPAQSSGGEPAAGRSPLGGFPPAYQRQGPRGFAAAALPSGGEEPPALPAPTPVAGYLPPKSRTPAAFEAFREALNRFQELSQKAALRLAPREEWKALRPKSDRIPVQTPVRFVLHHTGVPGHSTRDEDGVRRYVKTIQENHMVHLPQEHRGSNFEDIGYHFVVSNNGVVYEGRWQRRRGEHAGDKGNENSVGVVLMGEFTSQRPGPEQLEALAGLLSFLAATYGMDLKAPDFLLGHAGYNRSTACPGANLKAVIPTLAAEIRRRIGPAGADPSR